MVAILIFSLHLQLLPGCSPLSRQAASGRPSRCLLQSRLEKKMSLIQLASLQKIVVALADHLLFGILGNQQSARIQLGTAFFHQA